MWHENYLNSLLYAKLVHSNHNNMTSTCFSKKLQTNQCIRLNLCHFQTNWLDDWNKCLALNKNLYFVLIIKSVSLSFSWNSLWIFFLSWSFICALMKLVGPVDTVGDFESEIFFGWFLFDFYFDFWPPIYLLHNQWNIQL
jgi:hypothetical protein